MRKENYLVAGDIILADEPTGSLDPELSEEAFDLLNTLRKEYHKTILMVTYNIAEAKKYD